MQIEEIKIKNFKVFKDIHIKSIPKLSALVGKNGTGKSTFFDIFSFIKDSLNGNVSKAVSKRGGFKELISRNCSGNISIAIKFRESVGGRLATYELEIAQGSDGKIVVAKELLKYRRVGKHGQPWNFLKFANGKGYAITNETIANSPEEQARENKELDAPDILAIKGLGQFKEFPVISEFRTMIEDWHISDFHISDARQTVEDGVAEHLSSRGDNIALVAQYLFEHHRDTFDQILKKMQQRVPGVSKVEAESTVDGRLVLRFQDGAFKDPFIAKYVSDGTIKMFAYLVLLNDPKPFPLLAVEEPENQLYPELLNQLAEEFRVYAEKGGQVFLSTHSPDLLNGLELKEIFCLVKKDGYTDIKRLSDDKQLVALYEAGDDLGSLWKQKLFS